ncbi:ATP-dependent DNA helicase MER3 [Coemansia sp. RSA 1286]|nr:ATP-dependent DNA helicase MER3 [Coemansia sp. RSA 1286]
MQSACFDSLYQSDDNMVISAPTSSGKTVLIELAICRVFRQERDRATSFPHVRALYLAPLKSLCAEKALEWQKRFVECEMNCSKLVGGDLCHSDSDEQSDPSLLKSHIVCATPEKWNLMIQKKSILNDYSLLKSVKLVIIDECHMVGSDRGAALELAVSQIRLSNLHVRFIATSATVGNIDDISEWLSNNSYQNDHLGVPARALVFGEEYRPVPLSKTVLGFPCNSAYFQFQRNLDFRLPEVINRHCSGKATLIFCSTRSSAQETSRFIAKNINRLSIKPMPIHLSSAFTNRLLNETVPFGIAYHHAGLSSSDRSRVEKLFISGSIQILCSTSTLGIGINLPAYAVIIKGTKGYVDNEYAEYSSTEIMQFIGRAGRPQFGQNGKAVILTESGMVNRYRNMVSGHEVLESRLAKDISRAVVSGVFTQQLTTDCDVLRWLGFTFLSVRARKAPQKYAMNVGNAGAITSADICAHIAAREIDRLQNAGLVNLYLSDKTRRNTAITVTELGKCVAKYMVEPIEMAYLLDDQRLPRGPSYQKVFEAISLYSGFSALRFTSGQKGVLNEMNKSEWLKFKVTNRVQTISDKAMILIQEKHVPALLQQIEGIGPKYSELLWKHGIKSIAALAEASVRDIEYLLNRNPPFGTRVLASASLFPVYRLSVDSYWVDRCSLVFSIKVDSDIKNSGSRPEDSNMQPAILRQVPFSVIAYTDDEQMLLLKFEVVDTLLQSICYETQIGLCNPTPGSKVVIEVAPETYVGCLQRFETTIPDYDFAESEAVSDSVADVELGLYDDLLEDLMVDSDYK